MKTEKAKPTKWKRCGAVLRLPNSDADIRCEAGEGHEGDHVHHAYKWKPGNNNLKQNGTSGVTYFRIGSLWLTNGGRIVKPGGGECASEKFNDILLMNEDEIQGGLQLEEFEKRLIAAKLKRNDNDCNRKFDCICQVQKEYFPDDIVLILSRKEAEIIKKHRAEGLYKLDEAIKKQTQGC